MRNLSYKLIIVAGVSALALSGSAVLAVSSEGAAHAQGAGVLTPSPTASPTTHGQSAGAESHLAAAQLKACQNRQQAINNIMSRIVDRGTKQIAVFDTIATRTETFYKNQGKTVANYATLVAAVNSAKAKAQTDLAAMKTTGILSCSGNDPKGVIKGFQKDLKIEIADLQAYKTAVKNLIVAVKSVQGTASSSPKPSGLPEASAHPSVSPSPSTAAGNQGGNQ